LLVGREVEFSNQNPFPTKKDIEDVCKYSELFGRKYPNPGFDVNKERHPITRWGLDKYGELRLYSGDKLAADICDRLDYIFFFSNKDWAKTLPSPTPRYRITNMADISKFPNYYNVTLTNIPTFKGLESDGVIFVFHNYIKGFDYHLIASLYVALSRAKNLLYIVSPINFYEEINRLNKIIMHQ
jgi:hypothetical protein